MNDKTIRNLYLGKIRPWNSKGFKTAAYDEHIEKFTQLYEDIKAALPKNSQSKLETMMEEYNSSQEDVIMDAFVKGFELGMRLTVEGLCSGNE